MVDPTLSLSGVLNRADAGHAGALEDQAPTPPTVLGRRVFIAGLAGATAAVTVGSSAHAAVPGGASYYAALDSPLRVADTRPGFPEKSYARISANTIRIKLTDFPGVASNAVAAVISIAVIGNGAGGYVRATPAGDTSFVANVLLDAQDSVVTNLATVKLSADGSVDITGSQPYNVVVDISGVYLPTTSTRRGGRLKYLSSVFRIADNVSVPHNGKLQISVAGHVPSSAAAVVVNLTAVFATGSGYLTAYPVGLASPPVVANVNFSTGETRGAGAIVKIGEAGGVRGFEVYLWGGARVYADISGYITGDTDEDSEAGLFVPIVPVRLLDTRRSADIASSGKRRLWPGWTRPFAIPANSSGFPAAAALSGLAMNVTSVASMNAGYITVLPAQTPRRIVSNLNISRPGQTVANHVVTQVSTKGVECYSWAGADVVCDVAGWYVGTAQPWTQPVPTDPPPPGASLPWTLSVPDIKKRYGQALVNQIRPDLFSADRVVDVGDSWHWTNTGLVGQSASVVIFGHRTSGSGPYYNQHRLNGANVLYVYTPDLRLFTYRRVREELTNSSATNILDATRRVAGETISMVACTGRGTPQSPGVLNDQPSGGIAWRIITTFALESWTDISPSIG